MLPTRPDLSPEALTHVVVWGGFALGLALGGVAQSTRFCVRGAIADWIVFRGPARLLSWLLAIAVGAIGVQALVSAGAFDASQTLGWSSRLVWASSLVGGLVFGYGMVLAEGCPHTCLVKAGAGNLRAAITLVVIAIASSMTLRGAFAGLRVNLMDALAVTLPGSQDLGALASRASGVGAGVARWMLVAATTFGVAAYGWRHRRALDAAHWAGGIGVGLLVAAAFYVTGAIGFVPEHPETLEPAWLGTHSHRPEGLSFAAPLGHALDLLTLWSDRNTVATFGVTIALGVLAGSFIAARLRGEFRVEGFRTVAELRSNALGGVLMGFGGVTALGCSIGNGVTGLALLSSGSLLATAGIVAGAWLALARQLHREQAAEASAVAA